MKKYILVALLIFQFPLASQALDFYTSGMLGVGTIDSKGLSGDQYDNSLTYGLRAGILIDEKFSAGLFFKELNTKDGAGPSTTVSHLMLEATYYFSGARENTFFISGLIGGTQIHESSTSFSQSSNEVGLSYGATAGYQFMVTDNFSLSPQVTYIYTQEAGRTDYSDLSAILNLQFWF